MRLVPIEEIPSKINPLPLLGDMIAVYKIASDMVRVCEQNNGIGLAAAQVGVPWQFFIVKTDAGFDFFFDCIYTPSGPEKAISVEGCLSLPNKRFAIERYLKVRVAGKKLVIQSNGDMIIQNHDQEYEGIPGVVFQHEIDHCFSKLISDIGKPVDFVSRIPFRTEK
jgi:peptide deformylase